MLYSATFRNAPRIIDCNLQDASALPDDHTFLKLFRLNKHAEYFIIQNISKHTNDGQRTTAIPTHLKIRATLNFLRHGCDFSMSESSVEMCTTINNVLLYKWITYPTNVEDANRSIQLFLNENGFPGTIGSIDCIHVAIISPQKEHPVYPAGPYYNRKGFYSTNVQINTRYPSCVHDTATWQMFSVNTYLEKLHLQGNLNYHLFGAEGYPLSLWLLTQYPRDIENDAPKGRFKACLRTARSTLERWSGILKSRFRCLLRHRTLNYNPVQSGMIILSCEVLDNIALQSNVPIPDNEEYFKNELMALEGERAENFFVQGSRNRDLIFNENFI